MWWNRRNSGTRFAAVAVSLTALAAMAGLTAGDSVSTQQGPPVRHVFVIVLENASYAQSYGPNSKYPYLSGVLRKQGVLLNQYYATSHYSLGNYLAMLGGVAPNADTQRDCPAYVPMTNARRAPMGQVSARTGCIYPTSVPTLAGQLTAQGLTWKGYMEDMGNIPGREEASCGKPSLGPFSADLTQQAAGGDAYAARHNPFLYFGSIVATPACAANVVPLTRMAADLSTVATTPNLSFISPSLCNDGHEMTCTGQAAGPAAEEAWLRTWVQLITASPAFRADGALFILTDEADADSSACCQEPSGPNVAHPGYPQTAVKDETFANSSGGGKGGGRTGALVISPFVRPGSTSTTAYNHYSFLKSIEDLFGLADLGYAGQPGLNGFGTDVWTRYGTTSSHTVAGIRK